MKRATVAVFLGSLLLCTVAESQPSPFAQAPSTSSPNWTQLSLGNIMLLIQARHAKIWYAARAQDWALVDYELSHISDDLAAAAMLYRDIPVELVTGAGRVIVRMKDAAKQKDATGLQSAFSDLTTACNACHAAGGVSFIRIQTPTNMPFTNQHIQSSVR
jgi:hypothetical protein